MTGTPAWEFDDTVRPVVTPSRIWSDGFALGVKIGETKAAIDGLRGKTVHVKISRDRALEFLEHCEQRGLAGTAAKVRAVYPELHWLTA